MKILLEGKKIFLNHSKQGALFISGLKCYIAKSWDRNGPSIRLGQQIIGFLQEKRREALVSGVYDELNNHQHRHFNKIVIMTEITVIAAKDKEGEQKSKSMMLLPGDQSKNDFRAHGNGGDKNMVS